VNAGRRLEEVSLVHGTSSSTENDHADNGSCFLKTFRVLNSVLRLIPNIVVNSLTGSPCW
jgi:hypothetical protein